VTLGALFRLYSEDTFIWSSIDSFITEDCKEDELLSMTKMLGFFDFIDLDFLVFTACLKEVSFEILENTLDLLN